MKTLITIVLVLVAIIIIMVMNWLISKYTGEKPEKEIDNNGFIE
jgi:hypothetical protein